MGGSLAVGITGLASASPSGSLVSQGAPGTSPWPVSATGTVGVNNFPPAPLVQSVSGTVGLDQANNGVSVTNWPKTQNVSGSVSISGTPKVISGDVTTEIYENNSVNAPPLLTVTPVPATDVSSYREVTLYMSDVNGSALCTVLYTTNEGDSFKFDSFTLGGASADYYSNTYDLAPPRIEVQCENPNSGPADDTLVATLTGRTN